MRPFLQTWSIEDGQGVTEYALIGALVLLLVMGTARLVGSKANHTLSRVVSVFQPQHDND